MIIIGYLGVFIFSLFLLGVYIFTLSFVYQEIQNGNFEHLLFLIPLCIIITLFILKIFNFI